jgi:hypothetical protein
MTLPTAGQRTMALRRPLAARNQVQEIVTAVCQSRIQASAIYSGRDRQGRAAATCLRRAMLRGLLALIAFAACRDVPPPKPEAEQIAEVAAVFGVAFPPGTRLAGMERWPRGDVMRAKVTITGARWPAFLGTLPIGEPAAAPRIGEAGDRYRVLGPQPPSHHSIRREEPPSLVVPDGRRRFEPRSHHDLPVALRFLILLPGARGRRGSCARAVAYSCTMAGAGYRMVHGVGVGSAGMREVARSRSHLAKQMEATYGPGNFQVDERM